MRGWHIAALGLLAWGCGARSDLEVGAEVSDAAVIRRDARRPPACEPVWSACRISAGPLLVSGTDLGQSPDVCWAGERLLVVYDSNSDGNTVAGVDLDGTVRFREGLGGIQAPRVACNPETGTGLVAMDTGLRWLGPDGRPVGDAVRLDLGFQMIGDVAAAAGGFTIMTGVNAYSSPPPLFGARLPPTPLSEVRLDRLAEGGPRYPPEHATDDAGFGTVAVSATREFDVAELWDLTAPGGPAMIRPVALSGTDPRALGMATLAGERFVLYSQNNPGSVWGYYLWNADTGHTRLVSESAMSLSGHLERLGDQLVAAVRTAPRGETLERVVIGPVGPVGVMLEGAFSLSEPGRTAHSARIARTPRGLAVVWSEGTGDTDGNSALLAVLDCCP